MKGNISGNISLTLLFLHLASLFTIYIFPGQTIHALVNIHDPGSSEQKSVTSSDQVEEWTGSETLDGNSNENFHDSKTEEGERRTARLMNWPPFLRGKGSNAVDVDCSVDQTQGVCKTRKCCEKEGGTILGSSNSCGTFDVCCIVRTTCAAGVHSAAVLHSGARIHQPYGYSAPYQCRFDIPQRPGICQVRLDFVSFRMSGPSMNGSLGECDMDLMTVTGAENLNKFTLCGNNDGQHLYLHYGGDSNKISLTMRLLTSDRDFDILVTFIKCPGSSTTTKGGNGRNKVGSPAVARNYGRLGALDLTGALEFPLNKYPVTSNLVQVEPAPAGCSQYFTSPSGSVQSFNYFSVPVVQDNSLQYQINNQQYTICVKGVQGSSEISWKTCAGGSFAISGVLPTNDLSFRPTTECLTDYIDIPGSQKGRYCGLEFPARVKSSAQPYAVYVNFDGQELLGVGDEDFNPATGCCLMCNCIDSMTQKPVTDYPCGAMNPNHVCTPNQHLSERTDFNNIGFCLDYAVN